MNVKRVLGRFIVVLLLVVQVAAPLGPAQSIGEVAEETRSGAEGEVREEGARGLIGVESGEESLVDLAAVLAGVAPDSEEAEALEIQLRTLESLPPAHEAVTRATLESMVSAKELQDHALRDLTPEQLQIVQEADPDGPVSPEMKEALSKVDMGSVAGALAALLEGSDKVQRIIDFHESYAGPVPGGAEDAFRDEFGVSVPPSLPVAHSVSPDAIAGDLVSISGLAPHETAVVADHLQGLPTEVREAIGVLTAGLAPLKHGAGPQTPEDLVRLGAAIDASRPVLETWSALVLTAQLFPVLMERPWDAFPDPDGDLPPLRWGSTRWTDGPLPPLDADPEETGRALASYFTDEDPLIDQAGEETQSVLSGLPPDQRDAVLYVLDAVREYVERHMEAANARLPEDVEPQDLARWSSMHEQGDLPEPGSLNAQALESAMPYMEAQRRAAVAKERLLQTVEELVPTFSTSQEEQAPEPPTPGGEDAPSVHQPASGHDDLVPELPPLPCVGDIEILFILAIDTCGVNSRWSSDVMVRIDVGGDDKYTGRLGAPIEASASGVSIGIPLTINLDLGGSDTYVTTEECAQGAACPDHPAAALDPTGVSGNSPLGVLVDWDGDNVTSANTFEAGNRSQGFYAPTNYGDNRTEALGLLIERIGTGGELVSRYQARARSQGSAVSLGQIHPDAHGGRGVLLRLVGSESVAEGTFEAGEQSQGSSSVGISGGSGAVSNRGSYSLAAFLNLAGTNATADDAYMAGSGSQGAMVPPDGTFGSSEVGNADAVFTDVVGPGSRSNDLYDISKGPGRGFVDDLFDRRSFGVNSVVHNPMRALFIDSALPRTFEPGERSIETEGSGTSFGVEVRPSWEGSVANGDVFRGGIEYGEGYGWTAGTYNGASSGPKISGGFYKIGGTDHYELHETWFDEDVDEGDRPRNNDVWPEDATPFLTEANSDMNMTWPKGTKPPAGVDTDLQDGDQDGYLTIMELFWPIWNAEMDDEDSSPVPLRSYLSLDSSREVVLNGTYGLVLLAGGDNTFLKGYSAALHMDFSGNDLHLGRVAAAGGLGDEEPSDQDPRIAQHLLSFHLDLDGHDTYESPLPRNQGYGEGGGIGLLVDGSGDDRFVGSERAQGVAMQGQEDTGTGFVGVVDDPVFFGPNIRVAGDGVEVSIESEERNEGIPATEEEVAVPASSGNLTMGPNNATVEADGQVEGVAAIHQGAGFGSYGVLLSLGDPSPNLQDRNWFHVDDGSQSQGYSDSTGRVGALIATGHHNTFSDNTTTERGGTSANLGDNDDPEVQDLTVGVVAEGEFSGVPMPLEPEKTYTFRAKVRDPDGDRVEVCFTFERGGSPEHHGDVVEETTCRWHGEDWDNGWRLVETDFTWGRDHMIHTDAMVDGLEASVPYEVRVNVTDPGGLYTEANESLDVFNEAPRLLGGVIGETDVPLDSERQLAYQVPFLLEEDTVDPTFVVDWGDGSKTVTQGDTVDWALAERGTTVQLPEAAPCHHRVNDDLLWGCSIPGSRTGDNPEHVIDGDNGNHATFQVLPGENSSSLAHLILEFPAARQVGTIAVNATVTQNPFDLSVEGIGLDGRPIPLGTIQVEPGSLVGDRVYSVVMPKRPLLQGVILKQVHADNPVDGTLEISRVQALGPGAERSWDRAGSFNVTFSVIDELGGRNATNVDVTVKPPKGRLEDVENRGDLAGVPFRLVDVADRGPVRHVSVGAYPINETETPPGSEEVIGRDPRLRPLRLNFTTSEGAEDPCITDEQGNRIEGVCAAIDWGDGSPVTRMSVPPQPDDSDDDTVEVDPIFPINDPDEGIIQLFHRWTEPGEYTIMLTYETNRGSTTSPVTTVHVESGLDLLSDGGTNPLLFITLENRTTWQFGFPHATSYQAIVDVGGDDRWFGRIATPRAAVSQSPGNFFFQGFSPSLVVDAAGDDDYLSTVYRTQGFGALAAVGLLVDGGGDDRYVAPGRAQGAADTSGAGMLVSLGGDDVWNPVPADHSAAAERFPDRFVAGPDQSRPEAIEAPRPSLLRNEAQLVQGAGEEGIGLLVAQGGMDTFVAGDRSQGYGAHDPRVQEATDYVLVNDPDNCFEDPTGQTQGDGVDWTLCLMGITYPSQNRPINQGPPPGVTTPCPSNIANPICMPGTDDLQNFVNNGPRYGPGLGLLLRADGPSGMRGGAWSQASSLEAGRGYLLDLDGGSVYAASERGQAFTKGGSSVLVVGGPHSTWLGSDGQFRGEPGDRNPEGTDPVGLPPMLAYLGGPRDERCEEQSRCGSGGAEPGVTVDEESSPFPRVPGPGLSWTGDHTFSDLRMIREDSLTLEVEVGQDETGQELQSEFETVALSMVHPGADQDSGKCRGEPIAGPIVLDPRTRRDADTESFPVELDLTRKTFDGRLLPAGCHRIHVFARHVDDATGAPLGDWGVLAGEAGFLKAPPLRLAGEAALTKTPTMAAEAETVLFTVFMPEPLAGSDQPNLIAEPDIEIFVTKDGDKLNPDSIKKEGPWVSGVDNEQFGARRVYALDPPDLDGKYVLKARTSWTGEDPNEDWILAHLIVDTQPPQATLDKEVRKVWRGGTQIVLTGNVTSFSTEVERVELRLVDASNSCLTDEPEECDPVNLYVPSLIVDRLCLDKVGNDRPLHCTMEVVPSFPTGLQPSVECPTDECAIYPPDTNQTEKDLYPGGGSLPNDRQTAAIQPAVLPAVLVDQQNETRAWWASIRTTPAFTGGELMVQVRTENAAGTQSPWTNLTESGPDGPALIMVDKDAPRVNRITAVGGAKGTNMSWPDPIPLEVELQDCASSDSVCIPGSGFLAQDVVAFVRDAAQGVIHAVDPNQKHCDDAGVCVLTLDWNGTDDGGPENGTDDGGPEQGTYETTLLARDEARNIVLVNPGARFHVDREPPEFLPGEQFEIPDGQEAIKPGDPVNVTAWADDRGSAPTWVHQVSAWIVSDDQNVTDLTRNPDAENRYSGQLVVPSGLLPEDENDNGIEVRVEVEVLDAALNPTRLKSPGLTYFEHPPELQDLETQVRSESIDVSWNTSRAVTFDEPVVLVDPEGAQVEGQVESDGVHHSIRFEPLEPETVYVPGVAMRDAAGFLVPLNETDHLPEITSLARAQASVALNPLADQTYSGEITVEAVLTNALDSTVSLHDGSRKNPPLVSIDVEPDLPGQETLTRELTFDSRVLEDTLDAARSVELLVVKDDGATFWKDSIDVRIDNAPPQATPFVEGPASHMGNWYNASVIVRSGASDDTGPIHHSVFINEEGPLVDDRVKFVEDGRYLVRFDLADAAVPSNNRTIEHEVVIDTRDPELEAWVEGNRTDVRELVVPLNVTASKPGASDPTVAPLDGIRIRLDDGPWSPWSLDAPENVTLPNGPDGHHWIHVETRDAVHNTVRESIPVLLDRTPPEVLSLSWIGYTAQGDAVLEYVVHDRINGTGQPSGVEALRVGGTAEPWMPTDGVGTIDLPPDPVTGASTSIRFKDEAGNIVTVTLPPVPNAEDPRPPADGDPPPRRSDLLRDPRVLPTAGHAGEPFTFTVIVLPRDGVQADSVWLEVAGLRVEMRPESSVLEDGGRLYTATVELPASRLDAPHSHRFEAVYGDETVSSPAFSGPLVTHLGSASLDDGSGLDENETIPSAGFPLMVPVFLIAIGAFILRREKR